MSSAPPQLFQLLSAEDAERLLALGTRRGLVKGRVLFRQGESATHALLLTEGRLSLTVGDGAGRCMVGDVWPGELVGIRALFEGDGQHNVTVQAEGNSRGWLFDREAFRKLQGTRVMALVQQHLIRAQLRRLRGTDAAVRKAWQLERAARARAEAPPPEPEALEQGGAGSLRAMIAKLLGGAE